MQTVTYGYTTQYIVILGQHDIPSGLRGSFAAWPHAGPPHPAAPLVSQMHGPRPASAHAQRSYSSRLCTLAFILHSAVHAFALMCNVFVELASSPIMTGISVMLRCKALPCIVPVEVCLPVPRLGPLLHPRCQAPMLSWIFLPVACTAPTPEHLRTGTRLWALCLSTLWT